MSSPRAGRSSSPEPSLPPSPLPSLEQASTYAPVQFSTPPPLRSPSPSHNLSSPPSPQPPSPAPLRSSSPKPPASPVLHQGSRENPLPRSPTADELLFQANEFLSLGNSRQAIDLYTIVLYEKAPGHIIAFLNRAMAYLQDQRPELAATDAYRAAMVIDATTKSPRQEYFSRELETKRYLRIEALHVELGREWTHRDRRYIPASAGTWATMPLASLVMDMDEDDCPVWDDLGFGDILPRLEVRAIFRLCGALFACKGGAIQEAAGLIEDFWHTRNIFGPEKKCFKYLGDSITNTITNFIDFARMNGQATDDEHVLLLPVNRIMTPKTKPESILKTRVTMVPALQYWDDPYEPNFANRYTHSDLSDMVADASDSCVPIAFDQSSVGLQARIGLHASRDQLPGDHILYDCRSWNVTTDSPDKFLETWYKRQEDCFRLYCDACATVLLLPDALLTYITADAIVAHLPKMEAKRRLTNTISKNSLDDEEREKRVAWALRTHVTWCARDHAVIYCSSTCRKRSRVFDAGVHELKLESTIRSDKIPTTALPMENLSPSHPRSLYAHSKAQTLYDLLFLRIYASALNQDKHPLELVKFLRGGLSRPWAGTQNQVSRTTHFMPWSFSNNIARPIWIVNQFHESLNQNPLRYLRQSDGWVINTLLAKIQRSTNITTGAMSAFTYRINDEEKSCYSRGLDQWVGNQNEAVYESDEAFKEVWVARLDPLVSLIRVADEARGEKPNCWLKYEDGVRVIAGQPDDPSDKQGVAISMGESLLRAKPQFLGGNPNDVVTYSQRESSLYTKIARSESPDIRDFAKDHPMTDARSETLKVPTVEQPVVPKSPDASHASMSTGDTEMLDILDNRSQEAADVEKNLSDVAKEALCTAEATDLTGTAPHAAREEFPSPPLWSPVNTDSVVDLDGQAESLKERPEAIANTASSPPDEIDEVEEALEREAEANIPALLGNFDEEEETLDDEAIAKPAASMPDEIDEVEEAWDRDDVYKSRLSFQKRRFSSPIPRDNGLMAQYRAGAIRVNRRSYSPTNSLVVRMKMGGAQSIAAPKFPTLEHRARSPSPSTREARCGAFLQQPRAETPPPPVSNEGRSGKSPFSPTFNPNVPGSMLGEGMEILVAAQTSRPLEMRGITDVRKRPAEPEVDVESGEASSKDEKGKTVVRDGDALL
ncbi:MAG: hypothetical protein LQ341_003259 [Variospora aurantia]|nr:MAG: hypothetical protein LQ341_003259 [Variospora aurantia]